MVRLREVTIIKDPSLLNDKIGPFKVKKAMIIGLGGMIGYSFIKNGTVADLILGFAIVAAAAMIAMGPDKALSFENVVQAAVNFYLFKPKSSSVDRAALESLKDEELEVKIANLRSKLKEEKDFIKKLRLKRELTETEAIYYTKSLADIDEKISELKDEMKTESGERKKRLAEKLKALNKKRSEIMKLKRKAEAELRKFADLVLIDKQEVAEAKKKADELKNHLNTLKKSGADDDAIKQLKRQYEFALLEYYTKLIDHHKAVIRFTKDKSVKAKLSKELKEANKMKSILEKKLGGGRR